MLTSTRPVVRMSLRRDLPVAIWLLALGVSVEVLYEYAGVRHDAITLGTVGVVVTAVAIFLSFRVSEAYDRWWEARKLWGRMVNDSRTFARQVTAWVRPERLGGDAEAVDKARRDIVLRHAAYVHTLSMSLRAGGHPGASAISSLGDRLSEQDKAVVGGAPNACTALLQLQAQQLASVCQPTMEDHQLLTEMDNSMRRFFDIQGGCERIKNTVFPASLTASTKLFVWITASLMPFAALETDGQFGWVEILVVVVMGFVFYKIDQVGTDLKNPFESSPDDTPMTALAYTIERDLRWMLGDDLPPATKAEGGVLL